jgi:hypothetical protein
MAVSSELFCWRRGSAPPALHAQRLQRYAKSNSQQICSPRFASPATLRAPPDSLTGAHAGVTRSGDTRSRTPKLTKMAVLCCFVPLCRLRQGLPVARPGGGYIHGSFFPCTASHGCAIRWQAGHALSTAAGSSRHCVRPSPWLSVCPSTPRRALGGTLPPSPTPTMSTLAAAGAATRSSAKTRGSRTATATGLTAAVGGAAGPWARVCLAGTGGCGSLGSTRRDTSVLWLAAAVLHSDLPMPATQSCFML